MTCVKTRKLAQIQNSSVIVRNFMTIEIILYWRFWIFWDTTTIFLIVQLVFYTTKSFCLYLCVLFVKVCLSDSIFVCPSVSLPVYLCVCLIVSLHVCPSVCMSICLYAFHFLILSGFSLTLKLNTLFCSLLLFCRVLNMPILV